MSDGELSNEAPISKEEWQHFHAVVDGAIKQATNSAGMVAEIPFVYRWPGEHGAFTHYIQAWNNDKLRFDERRKGVSARLGGHEGSVRVYTGEWKNIRGMMQHEYLDMTGKSGPWNAILRDMVTQIERGTQPRRNPSRVPLISRAEHQQREAELDRRARAALSYQKPQTTGCFIATAAFENKDHPMVNELRFARDEILMYSKPGRRFVDWYYKNGPKMADFVVDNPSLKMAVRVLLTPLGQAVRLGRQIVNKSRSLKKLG
jgi:hypothetical protein